MSLRSVEMPSGHALFPFADSPHITQEGFIIHGSNPETRAKVYRLLLHREIISNPQEGCPGGPQPLRLDTGGRHSDTSLSIQFTPISRTQTGAIGLGDIRQGRPG